MLRAVEVVTENVKWKIDPEKRTSPRNEPFNGFHLNWSEGRSPSVGIAHTCRRLQRRSGTLGLQMSRDRSRKPMGRCLERPRPG